MKWIDLTEELTEEGKNKIQVGQVLLFDNGTKNGIQLKIMRKARGKVWAKEVYLYKEEEIFVKGTDETFDTPNMNKNRKTAIDNHKRTGNK